VCRFHVAAGEKLHADKQFIWRPCPECHEASKHHLLKFGFLLLVRLNLGFTTEERLAVVLIIPSSWGSQRAILTSQHMPLHADRRPNPPLHGHPYVDPNLGWSPCLPDLLAAGEELQPNDECSVGRASRIGGVCGPLPL
jgi:hypothetical protein